MYRNPPAAGSHKEPHATEPLTGEPEPEKRPTEPTSAISQPQGTIAYPRVSPDCMGSGNVKDGACMSLTWATLSSNWSGLSFLILCRGVAIFLHRERERETERQRHKPHTPKPPITSPLPAVLKIWINKRELKDPLKVHIFADALLTEGAMEDFSIV